MNACVTKSQDDDAGENKKQLENTYNTVEELREKAAANPEFIHSKEYASQMERAGIEMSKTTNHLKKYEVLLMEYEIALKNLKHSSDKIKSNPNLTENELFMTEMQRKADKVRAYYQTLKTMKLSQMETENFIRLSHQ
ncbi:MAG TPA: hypothetical protein PKH58_08990 [Paludibacteraceae bacterium]|nr:hypothetical protein [Paludibacteraceae bacterium]